MESDFEKGIKFFNKGDFHEAHEAWERLWKTTGRSAEKDFIQGLIMVAAALHHYKRKEFSGTLKLLERGMHMLQSSMEADVGIDKEGFAGEARRFYEILKTSGPDSLAGELPHIRQAAQDPGDCPYLRTKRSGVVE